MRLRLKFLAAFLLVATACSKTVEIPADQVGIVYENNEVQDGVLKAGTHTINYFAAVSLYDIDRQRMDFKFDILFNDNASAEISFSIHYILNIHNLGDVCKRYEQRVDHTSLAPIIESEVKEQVRNLLITARLQTDDTTKLFELIESNLKTKAPVSEIIVLKKFESGSID